MPRYVAFLCGVSPFNAKMPALKSCFKGAGFTNVRTVLSSGNVVFDARAASDATLELKDESAMQDALGRSFYTIVRRVDHLLALLQTDPYYTFTLPANGNQVVSFLREPRSSKLALPLESDGAQVLGIVGIEMFTAYVPSENGPVFMKLIEKSFGTDVTTRT